MKDLCRKLAVCLLVFAMCLSLSSCGVFSLNPLPPAETDEPAPEETEPEDDEPDIYRSNYSSDAKTFRKYYKNKNYSNGACKIVVAGRNIVVPDENETTVISKELNARNDAVLLNYKMSVVGEARDASVIGEELRQSVRSGSYYADAVLIPQPLISSLAAEGVLANLKSLPGFEYDTPFLFNTSYKAAGGGERVYAVAGPASLTPDALSGIFFNKDIISASGLESPYDLVDRGEWTVEKYMEYASVAGEGVSSACAGRMANSAADLFYFGMGGRLTDFEFGKYPTLSLSGEGAASIVSKTASALNGKLTVSGSAIGDFASGKSVFLIDKLTSMKELANASCDWGLLPFPKLSAEQQGYCSLADGSNAMFFAVPVNAPNYAMSGDVINGINIMSYGYTRDAYATEAAYYYLRDNQSIRMMSLIMETPVYDGAYTFSDANSAVSLATFETLRSSVGGGDLTGYIESYSTPFENAMYYLFKID